MSPRVLFLIRDLRLGGAERVLVLLLRNLRRVTPVVLLHRRDIAPENALPEGVDCFGLDTEAAGDDGRGREPLVSTIPLFGRLLEARRIARVARREDCGVVSSFLLKSNRIALFAKIFFDRRLRVLVNVHEFTSLHIRHTHSPWTRGFHRWIVRRIVNRADRILAPSEGVKADLVRGFGARPDLVGVLPNPIDLESVRRGGAEPAGPGPWDRPGAMLVGVGRLVPVKGFDLLIRALAALPAELGAHLVLVGDGEERAALEAVARERGVADRVTFTGALANPWKVMSRADVFVLSSRTEALPNVIGESFALGLPVVAAECTAGVRDLLDGGENGLLVEPGDPDALARGVERMLGDRKLRETFARRGPEVAARFDLPSVVERYEKELTALLG